MGIIDYLLLGAILGGAVYILYRSFWVNRGSCSGCASSPTCELKNKPFQPDFKKDPL